MQVKHILSSYFWLLLSCLVCASCDKDDAQDQPPTPGSVMTFEVGFAPANEGHTWQAGDAIGFYAVQSGSQLQSSNNAIHNAKLVYNGTTWAPEGELRWPGGGIALDFYAYAPYDASATDPLNFIFGIQADQSGSSDDRSNFDLSDLLTAKTVKVAENKLVTVAFDHALALVQVSAQNGAIKGMGPSQNMSVLLDVCGTSNFNLGDMTMTAADQVSVIMCRMEQPEDANYLTCYTYRAWVPAQNMTTGKSILVFKAESGVEFADDELAADLELTPVETTVLERPVSGLWQTVKILNGKFMMGSPKSEPGRDADEPLHEVTLTRDFHMCQYEITNTQYAEFLNTVGIGEDGKYMTANKGEQTLIRVQVNKGVLWSSDKWVPVEGCANHPVLNVSWYGADEYARWAGGTLPTEAQWEYACRAGTQTAYSFGDDASLLADYGWYYDNAYTTWTREVGTRLPNPWGLYDMHGNLFEWCLDTRDGRSSPEDYEPATDPISPHPGKYHLLRGGSWIKEAKTSRSACRYSSAPQLFHYLNGFRIIWVL